MALGEAGITPEGDVLERALRSVHEGLARYYGLPRNRRSHPTEELVATILSQNTNDANRDRAYAQLVARFPTWDGVAAADTAELEAAIRPGGLAESKAPRIQEALRRVSERFGSYDLSPLCSWETEAARAWLRSLPGVGPKTAACVLLFSCEKPVMPVDTHILRVAKRLGLLAGGTSAERAHTLLEGRVPPERIYALHVNLIHHGRETCQARAPRCGACVLRDVCAYPDKTA